MVTTGLVAVLLLLLIVVVVSFRTTSMFVETTLWVADTRKVLEELRQWHAQIEVTDADELRYLTSGDIRFKQAVEQDKQSTIKEMNDVIEVVQNNPDRRASIDRIRYLAATKADFMDRKISELEHAENASDLAWVPKSNDLLWQVRRRITDMINVESARLERRSHQAERLGRRVLLAMPGTIGLSLCTLGATILLLNREVTHRIRAEDEVRQSNKQLDHRIRDRTAELQTALNELEGFSYSVAHDLRAPIRAIGGYTGILSETCGDCLSNDGRELLDTVGKEAGRMGRLIDDLLRFSRLTRQPMEASAVDMTASAGVAFEELSTATTGRAFDFRLSSLPQVFGDSAMLRQVWVNLLANAIKFTADRQTAIIEVTSVSSETETVYCVKDNGAGFEMRYVGKLFKPFQRLHGEDEFLGTGIGLALVERIVRRHRGRVWAEGKPGHGAAFYFALPRNRS